MRRRVLFLSPLLLVCCSFGTTSSAQKPRLLDKSTFFQMESVASPAMSPDGSTILFSRGYADLMRNRNRSNLWAINIAGNRLRQFSRRRVERLGARLVA